jgi:hypothetical protein
MGMNREFTPYDRALKLKELGFDESCFGFYSKIYGLVIGRTTGNGALYENSILWIKSTRTNG